MCLPCAFLTPLHIGGGGGGSFMLLTNESLRLRLRAAAQQTNGITMTKVCGRMRYDKGTAKIERAPPLISHTLVGGQSKALRSSRAFLTSSDMPLHCRKRKNFIIYIQAPSTGRMFYGETLGTVLPNKGHTGSNMDHISSQGSFKPYSQLML